MQKLQRAVRIDAGGIRDLVCVEKEKHKWFFKRMHELNNRIAKLQRLKKWRVLKKLRNRQRNLVEDFRREAGARVRGKSEKKRLGGDWHPRAHPRGAGVQGDGSRVQRKRLNRWSFRWQVWWIRSKALEQGVVAVELNERGTTHRCYLDGSEMVELADRMLRCTRCGLEIDRDVNGAINIALKAMSNQGFPRGTGAVVNPPELRMSWPQKPASAGAPCESWG